MRFIIFTSLFAFLGCSVYVKPAPVSGEVYVQRTTPTYTTVYIETMPPPPRVEYRPAPRAGYVWVGGYWHWSGAQWIWFQGHWEAERVGYVWVAPRYETHNHKNVYIQGGWEVNGSYKATHKQGYKTNKSQKGHKK
jgi:hypothetical protein